MVAEWEVEEESAELDAAVKCCEGERCVDNGLDSIETCSRQRLTDELNCVLVFQTLIPRRARRFWVRGLLVLYRGFVFLSGFWPPVFLTDVVLFPNVHWTIDALGRSECDPPSYGDLIFNILDLTSHLSYSLQVA